MLTQNPPAVEGLFAAVQPLFWVLLLLYLFPGLFSDPAAQALVESCHLDSFLASPLPA